MTDGIRRDLDTLGAAYAIPDGPVDRRAVFGRDAPLVLEIGSGHGEAAVGFATAHPDHDLIAIDVHRSGMRKLLRAIHERPLPNVRVFLGDAVGVLDHRIASGSLAAVHLFFPDPWPKRAQRKRRFVRPDLLDLVADRLVPGGLLRTATDDPNYAEQMDEVFDAHPRFAVTSNDRPAWRPLTTYETKARAEGRTAVEFTVQRQD